MACNLSAGRQEVCKESIGGLQGVYFVNYTTGSFTKNASGEVTALPSGSTVYYYQLKGNSNYTETVNSSRDNGTTFFSQALVLNLKKLTNEMTTQLKLMAYGRPQIIVWTNNGDSLLVGEKLGADVTAGTIQTGGALGDLYGYSVTFTGMEQLPASFLSGSTTTNAFAGLSTQPTIVYGS
ncbi:hypothetical protein UFOVP1475_26 [uncultured Caudovirales phage]|uniref:Uncharacterized protein n=1 Tax=uncultured Caudovirales phage TaxID=2100421 RepID=A0A6J5SN47_9CAUD|nr:hypothetical protein UFOVP1475_26 [uncultured Caudovirales phage]